MDFMAGYLSPLVLKVGGREDGRNFGSRSLRNEKAYKSIESVIKVER